jgi:hypothetical protein
MEVDYRAGFDSPAAFLREPMTSTSTGSADGRERLRSPPLAVSD